MQLHLPQHIHLRVLDRKLTAPCMSLSGLQIQIPLYRGSNPDIIAFKRSSNYYKPERPVRPCHGGSIELMRGRGGMYHSRERCTRSLGKCLLRWVSVLCSYCCALPWLNGRLPESSKRKPRFGMFCISGKVIL